jgi:hypothetical protein
LEGVVDASWGARGAGYGEGFGHGWGLWCFQSGLYEMKKGGMSV